MKEAISAVFSLVAAVSLLAAVCSILAGYQAASYASYAHDKRRRRAKKMLVISTLALAASASVFYFCWYHFAWYN